MAFRDALKAAALSLVFLVFLLGLWHVATLPKEKASAAEDEYAKLMGKGAAKSDGFPTPAQLGETINKAAMDSLKTPTKGDRAEKSRKGGLRRSGRTYRKTSEHGGQPRRQNDHPPCNPATKAPAPLPNP